MGLASRPPRRNVSRSTVGVMYNIHCLLNETVSRRALLFAVVPVPLEAQSTKAELFGTVRDAAQLPVPGTLVELERQETGTRSSAVADENGAYHFFALLPGRYRLRVSKGSFQPRIGVSRRDTWAAS